MPINRRLNPNPAFPFAPDGAAPRLLYKGFPPWLADSSFILLIISINFWFWFWVMGFMVLNKSILFFFVLIRKWRRKQIPMRKITQIDRKCRMTLQTAAWVPSKSQFSHPPTASPFRVVPYPVRRRLAVVGRDHCDFVSPLCVWFETGLWGYVFA